MIRYFQKFKKSDPVQSPHFEYYIITEIRYLDTQFRLKSSFEHESDPMQPRRKVMVVFDETRSIIGFLAQHGYFRNEPLEFTIEIYSRIANDEIKIIGNGKKTDLANLHLEYETMRIFGYIPDSEPTMILNDEEGMEVTVLKTDVPWDYPEQCN